MPFASPTLHRLRLEAGIKSGPFAKLVEASRNHYSNVEHRRKPGSPELFGRCALVLSRTLDRELEASVLIDGAIAEPVKASPGAPRTRPRPPAGPTAAAPHGIAPEWMSVRQVAVYVGRHPGTVRRALLEYRRTRGRAGLKGGQRGAHASWRVHRADVDRWVNGKPPARSTRRVSAA